MNEDYITISVTINDLNQRIDVFLSKKIEQISRNRIIKLIKENKVLFNKKLIDSQSFIIKSIGLIEINIPKPKEYLLKPLKMQLDVLYEDENLILINKEAGVVVHPGAGNYENTLVNGLLDHCKNSLSGIGGVLRPGIVHRIDKMTSGILIAAKDDFTHYELSKQFKNRTINRKYICITMNSMPKNEGEINENIKRSKINRKKMIVCKSNEGKKAITTYSLLKKFAITKDLNFNFYECKLKTGRTHQIRVHFSYMKTPILGDSTYKRSKSFKNIPEKIETIIKSHFITPKRQALHAKSIGFFHPVKKKEMNFESELPYDFKYLLDCLEKQEY